MTDTTFTIIDDGKPTTVRASVASERVQLSPAAIQVALGWELGPDGLCRDTACVPVPPATASRGHGMDLADLAALLDRPLALDLSERAAYLGVSARDRRTALVGLEAPDFALPDLDGRVHSLSEHRGKKVLLVAYASW
jgi:AhpC/TSA family